MGGETFYTRSKGKTARDAFNAAKSEAQHECGHGGYTGTIAEKPDFEMIEIPAGSDALQFAEKMVFDGDPRIDDKWGNAGCIDLGDGNFLFFGWASS